MTENPANAVYDREIVTTRIFDAPLSLVWHAWSEPAHLAQWWGPAGFTNNFHVFEFRPGGVWRHVMRGPDGTEYPNESRFVEILAPRRIVLDHVSAPRFRLTVTFEDLEGRTKITFRQLFETEAARDAVKRHAVIGNEQNFDRLAGRLAALDLGSREFRLTRIFDAPLSLVWQAWTDPSHLARWWGPKGFSNPVCEIDPRPGGAIRIVMRGPDGAEYPMRGAFVELVAPERLVFTNIAIDADNNPLIDGITTVSFTERDGRTEMTLYTRGVARVDRATQWIAGMDAGWTQSIDRLAADLANAAAAR